MDIRIGGPSPVGPPGPRAADSPEPIEARVLSIRPARSRARPPRTERERREGTSEQDPLGGRVLVLLIPQGHRLPAGLEKGDYRVFLRIARR